VRIFIVSGTSAPRLDSAANHRAYAARHGYKYRFDVGPAVGPRVHYFKLGAVARALPDCEWLFWIDDDAFFTDLDRRLEPFIESLDPRVSVVFCAGPVNPYGQTTYLNAGVFFIRNCPEAFAFLDELKQRPIDPVGEWWDARTLGMYTASDQDVITYMAHTSEWRDRILVVPYDAFNNRPYHYHHSATEHLVVHFPGVRNKAAAIAEFATRWHLDPSTLLPAPARPISRGPTYGSPARHILLRPLRIERGRREQWEGRDEREQTD